MSQLESSGVTVDRSFNTTTTELNGITVSSKTTTRFTLVLPKEARIKASFSKEGLVKKLVKLFKKELQTGDQAFDDAVYISTDTPEATATFLTDPNLRAIIAELVEHGGVEIEGTALSCELIGKVQNEPDELVRLVKAALG